MHSRQPELELIEELVFMAHAKLSKFNHDMKQFFHKTTIRILRLRRLPKKQPAPELELEMAPLPLALKVRSTADIVGSLAVPVHRLRKAQPQKQQAPRYQPRLTAVDELQELTENLNLEPRRVEAPSLRLRMQPPSLVAVLRQKRESIELQLSFMLLLSALVRDLTELLGVSSAEGRFSQLAELMLMSIALNELLRNSGQARPVYQQRPLSGLDVMMDSLFSRPRSNPQPRPQQFFAPNYYRRPAPSVMPAAPRNDRRLDAVGFPPELIPEEYTCEIMKSVMDNPVSLPDTRQVCDGASVLASLARTPVNPFNRQPMRPSDATPQPELKAEIGRYVDAVVEGVKNKQAELGQQKLPQAVYESINQAAQRQAKAATPQNRPSASPTLGPKFGG